MFGASHLKNCDTQFAELKAVLASNVRRTGSSPAQLCAI